MDRYPQGDRLERPPPSAMYRFGGHQPDQQQQQVTPRPPGTFSFQVPNGAPPGPRFPQQSQTNASQSQPSQGPRPQYDPGRRGRGGQRGRGGRSGRSGRGGRVGRGSWKPSHASDRPLLNNQRAPTPDQMEGMDAGDAKFKNLSDSTEEEMELESAGEQQPLTHYQEDNGPPAQKRARLMDNKDEDSSVPKWSNPDPYTALPPPNETTGKRVDVVKLIRKSKASASVKSPATKGADDFIPFNVGDQDDEGQVSSDEDSVLEIRDSRALGRGSAFSHLDNLYPDRFRQTSSGKEGDLNNGAKVYVTNLALDTTTSQLRELFGPYEPGSIVIPLNKATGRSSGYAFVFVPTMSVAQRAVSELRGVSISGRMLVIELAKDQRDASGPSRSTTSAPDASLLPSPVGSRSRLPTHITPVETWPPPPPPPSYPYPQADVAPNSRKGRKRLADNFDNDDDSVVDSREGVTNGKKRKHTFDFDVVPAWRPTRASDTTPWMRGNSSLGDNAATMLHNEIRDFYDYVKPRHFENAMREQLVQRLQRCLDRAMPGAEIRFFGSFAAGLYLPEGDMDLVVFSQRFRQHGVPTLQTGYKHLRNFASMLQRDGIPKPGSVICIAKAKVPIVKYIDQLTGLRVDISFENDTGVIANATYSDWKVDFPAMPVLVTLVKQYLLMRNMNEVHTGGLGGFSVTCLVISLMQNMPAIATGNLDPSKNLGGVFLTFLDYYGNKFDMAQYGIELDPPKYFPKKNDPRVKRRQAGQPPKLSIIDPNDFENDISGGSSLVSKIFRSFSVSNQVLRDAMDRCQDSKNDKPDSILGSLYAGNYTSFEQQRARMNRLYTESSQISERMPRTKGKDVECAETALAHLEMQRRLELENRLAAPSTDLTVVGSASGSTNQFIPSTDHRAYASSLSYGAFPDQGSRPASIQAQPESSYIVAHREHPTHSHAQAVQRTLLQPLQSDQLVGSGMRGRRLLLANAGDDVRKKQVMSIFKDYHVIDVWLVVRFKTGGASGFIAIDFASVRQAEKARARENGQIFLDRQITLQRVEYALKGNALKRLRGKTPKKKCKKEKPKKRTAKVGPGLEQCTPADVNINAGLSTLCPNIGASTSTDFFSQAGSSVRTIIAGHEDPGLLLLLEGLHLESHGRY